MFAIRLDEKTETRLDKLAENTGSPKTWYVRKAIEAYLDDLEDAASAATAYENYLLDGGQSSPLEEVRRRLGLEG